MESTELDQEAVRLTTKTKRKSGWIFAILLVLFVWQSGSLAYAGDGGNVPITNLVTAVALGIVLILVGDNSINVIYTLTRTNDSLRKEKARLAEELAEAKAEIAELERLKKEAMPYLVRRRAAHALADRNLIAEMLTSEFGDTNADTLPPDSSTS